MPSQNQLPPELSRRSAIAAFGVLGLSSVFVAACSSGDSVPALDELGAQAPTTAPQTTATSGAPAVCTLTPETTEGPYYIDYDMVRADITEGRPGLPVDLQISVVDATTCQPIPGAAVDVWHCDALGFYSGFAASPDSGGSGDVPEGLEDERFLRGIQLTGDTGTASFRTIYPGWYVGRPIHVHMKVHVAGTAVGTTFDGGSTVHTGQLFYPDDVTDEVARIAPYSGRDTRRTLLTQDRIYSQAGGESALVALTPATAGTVAGGFTATATVAVQS